MEPVEVIRFDLVPGDRPLKALADIRLGEDLFILGVKVVEGKKKSAKVFLPQASWQGSDGRIYYADIFKLSQRLQEVLEQAILGRFDEETKLKELNDAGPTPTH